MGKQQAGTWSSESLARGPGSEAYDFSITGQLGQGRVGAVHVVEIRSCSIPVAVPPLVVKVANRDFCDKLSKEAWMYEEMEALQGVAIPRCYGYFLSEIPPHTKVLGWDRVATTKLPISILLLERLGDHLRLGEPIPQTIQDDLWCITKDLGELHIFDNDLRYDNVLLAPASPPGLPSLVSPYSHRSYELRLVDFDTAYKINFPPWLLVAHHRHLVELILDNVPDGNVVNLFDDD
ncbi:hypothetical protein GLOTRDRAFT_95006 [Gloeophyllum trabeum ATCC 11539]|uniref:Protein kinase domain-containing protein n=1 Tax=Gloeophyllum trabeum (strain ATCC 11539 / FP-39264 / Madison 617) TaxID=670483 RepID=S7PZ65_GLOTA|nr:uncharacterized protein GLOTRDRAFT_95006 [Gloeophyllum trabeum ATCC 11539]EPQ52941.1 hypothetical protein GLOTRDRAFT_95006 [Gloeophyllum trabeum ATCC 11539]